MATALIRPHPLSARDQRTLELPEGLTIAEMVVLVWPATVAREYAAVFVGAHRVPAEHWARVRPKAGALVRMGLTLSGGEGGGKQVLAMVAMVAIAIVAPQFGVWMAGAQGFAAGVYAAGFTIVGSLVVQALFKPAGIAAGSAAGRSPAESATYSFGGQSNQATPYGPVPRVYGSHRIFPRVAAAPFAASEGPNQFLYMLLDCGYGPLQIEQLRIGDTPIEHFRDTQFVIHPEWRAGDPLTIYLNDVAYESLNVTLATDTPEIRISAPDASTIALEFACPRGLVRFDDRGNRQIHDVGFSVFIRPAGSAGAFESITERLHYSSRAIGTGLNVGPVAATGPDTIGRFGRGFLAGRTRFAANLNGAVIALGDLLVIRGAEYTITNILVPGDPRQATVIDFAPGLAETITAATMEVPVLRPTVDTIVVTDSTAQPVFFSLSFDVAPGQWEIKVTRVTPESASTQVADVLSWVALRSSGPRPVVATREAHTIIELKIRASDQLSGVVQNVNCIATALLEVRAGDGSWSVQPTRNPAWAYLDALRGRAALRPLVDARIDFDSIAAWAAYCDAIVPNGIDGQPEERVRFDHVVDYTTTTFQLLQSIAAAGRATPTIVDGRHGVLVDAEQVVPVQLFTPRNSWGFSARRGYITEPHGLRVKFIDPLNWQEGEIVIYAPGYSALNAVTFEELKLFGVTRHTQATRDGRYMKAQALLRREEFEIQCDVESLIATRGDLVAVQHDVLEVGGDSTRVQSLAGDELTVADAFGNLAPGSYGVRIRLSDGTVSAPIAAVPIGPATWRLAAVPVPAPAAGDLLAWGVLTQEAGEYLVKTVQPGPDFTATLSLAEVARGIYGADAGEIPPYVPPAGGRPTLEAPAPERLRAVQLDKTIGREPYADVVLYWDAPSGAAYSRYKIARVAPGGIETQIAETFTTSAQVEQSVRLLDAAALTTVTRYGVVGIDAIGQQSVAAFIDVQLVDPLFVPDAPGFMSSNVHDKTTTLTWRAAGGANPGNGQVLFYEVRWVPLDAPASSWSDAARVTELVPWNITTVTVPSRNGRYLVKALTASRVESEVAAVTVTAVEDLVIQDLFHTIDFHPAWNGTHDGTELDALGRLTLARNPDGTFVPLGTFVSNEREVFSDQLQCRISSRCVAQGANFTRMMADWVPLASAAPLSSVRRGVDWDVSVWVNAAPDAPGVMSDWVPLASAVPLDPAPTRNEDDWRPLIHGEYLGREIRFALVLESLHPNIAPIVSAAGADIDFPERAENYSDVAVPAAGLDFVFAWPFALVPAVAIDLQDAAPGDFVERGPVLTSGLHIAIKNGAAAVAGVVDVNAFGVGRVVPYVPPPTPPEITTASLPAPVDGVAYSQTIIATGTAPITFALQSGALPTGLTLSSAGVVSGTTSAAGTFNFTVRATNAHGFDDQAFSLTTLFAPVITTASLPAPVGGVAYSQPITATGTAPITFALQSGALPTGLTLSSAGVVSGTTNAAGTFNFTVRATNALGFDDQALSFIVAFIVDAADFDGTVRLARGAALSGVANSKLITGSAFVRWDGSNAVQQFIFRGVSAVGGATARGFSFYKAATSNQMGFAAQDAAGTLILNRTTTATFVAGALWIHYLFAFDMADTAKAKIRLNDVAGALNAGTYTNAEIGWNLALDFGVGGAPSGATLLNGCLAEVMLWPGVWLDIDVEANRRMFITAAGKPENPNIAGGAFATLGAPAIYHHLDNGEAVANFALNRGTAGAFALTGTLTPASTSPSD